jgi:hypothetical protein
MKAVNAIQASSDKGLGKKVSCTSGTQHPRTHSNTHAGRPPRFRARGAVAGPCLGPLQSPQALLAGPKRRPGKVEGVGVVGERWEQQQRQQRRGMCWVGWMDGWMECSSWSILIDRSNRSNPSALHRHHPNPPPPPPPPHTHTQYTPQATTPPTTPTTTPTTPIADDEWRSAGGAWGLLLCLLLPFLTTLLLRLLTAHLLPFLLAALALVHGGLALLLSVHWRVGAALARGLGAVFGLALPSPYDLLALGGAVALLAGREHARHLRYVYVCVCGGGGGWTVGWLGG